MDNKRSHLAAKTEEYVNKHKAFPTLTRTNADKMQALQLKKQNQRNQTPKLKKLSVQATGNNVFSQLHKAFAYNSIYLREPDSCLMITGLSNARKWH